MTKQIYLKDLIKPNLLPKLKIKKGQVPNFLKNFDKNNQYQASIWSDKTYKVDPRTHIFTTIQERFGNRILRSFKLPKGGVAVDIGCFIGEKLWQLKNNKEYLGVGVDIAVSSVKAAQTIDIYNHKFIAADMEDLPFKNKSVDLCLVFDVIEHLSHVEKGFSELSRTIKPGGKVLIHIPIKDNKFSFFWWKQKFFPKEAEKDYLDVGHAPERMLTSKQVKAYLRKYGFKVEREIYYNSFFVHFWDREFFKLLALLSVKLFRSGKANLNETRTTHTGSLGKVRGYYGKYIIPILEIISFPDWLLSKMKIGNTYFCIAIRQK